MRVDLLIKARENRGLSMRELSNRTGISYSLISKVENGVYGNVTIDKIKKWSDYLDVDIVELLEIEDTTNNLEVHPSGVVDFSNANPDSLKIVGYATAGDLFEQVQEDLGEIRVPIKYSNRRKYMAVKVSGDSMDKHLPDGCIALFNKQSDYYNNKIVLIQVGNETTIKRFTEQNEFILLSPESNNSEHQPIILNKEAIEDCLIYGTLAWYCVDVEE